MKSFDNFIFIFFEDGDDEEIMNESDSNIQGSATLLYAPKSLVIVSRFEYFEILKVFELFFQYLSENFDWNFLKNCLRIIYAVYADKLSIEIESLIGTLLGGVIVPNAGCAPFKFSLGAGDRQILQPVLNPEIPVTHSTVASLFNELGLKFQFFNLGISSLLQL